MTRELSLARVSEFLMGMDDATWARHANPWSGWSRVSILPMLTLAIWSRTWIGEAALLPIVFVLLWIWLNPRVFPAPISTDNWMSRGVLGERIWIDADRQKIPKHHLRMVLILNCAAVVGVVVLILGVVRLHVGFTLIGLLIAMGAKLWFLDRMVWLLSDMRKASGDQPQ